MIINSVPIVSTASLLLNSLIAALAFYSAWNNLVKKQITTFGLDALLILIAHAITKVRTQKLREDPSIPKRMGFVMLLLGISALRIWIIFFTQ
jgi:hypothetical protein